MARKRRLREYVESHGGTAEVARRAGCTSSYISQLVQPAYAAGEVAMRNLARRLFLPDDFFDADNDSRVVRHTTAVEVPLYEWETVGTLEKPLKTIAAIGRGITFALRMRGDSMASAGSRSIPDGALLFVDGNAAAQVDDVVVARLPGASAATCRQLIEDSGFLYLRPWNVAYPLIKLTPDVRALGVVRVVQQQW